MRMGSLTSGQWACPLVTVSRSPHVDDVVVVEGSNLSNPSNPRNLDFARFLGLLTWSIRKLSSVWSVCGGAGGVVLR